MSDDLTVAQQLGDMTMTALDDLNDGEVMVGAVLLVAVTAPDSGVYRTNWIVPDNQYFPTTLGIVEGWRIEQQAGISVSLIELDDEDDDEADDE